MPITRDMVELMHRQNAPALVYLCESLVREPSGFRNLEPDALIRLLELVDADIREKVMFALAHPTEEARRRHETEQFREGVGRWFHGLMNILAVASALVFAGLLAWTLAVDSGPEFSAGASEEVQLALQKAYWRDHPLYRSLPFLPTLTIAMLGTAVGSLVLKLVVAWWPAVWRLAVWGFLLGAAAQGAGQAGFYGMLVVIIGYYWIKSSSSSSSYTASASRPRTSGARLAR